MGCHTFFDEMYTIEDVRRTAADNRLLSMEIEFSQRCNFRCPYCYLETRPEAAELSEDESRDIILQAKDMGARTIIILGGEPMIYPRIMAMIAFIREHDVAPDGSVWILVMDDATDPNRLISDGLYVITPEAAATSEAVATQPPASDKARADEATTTTLDLLPGVDLVTEEVEPGVVAVLKEEAEVVIDTIRPSCAGSKEAVSNSCTTNPPKSICCNRPAPWHRPAKDRTPTSSWVKAAASPRRGTWCMQTTTVSLPMASKAASNTIGSITTCAGASWTTGRGGLSGVTRFTPTTAASTVWGATTTTTPA